MLLTKINKRLSGMTLIEVTVGMVVIIIVTLIAYMGVSAGANFTNRGTDLRNADGPAVSMMEAEKEALQNGNLPAVTAVKAKYQLKQKIYINNKDAAVTAVTEVTISTGQIDAQLIKAEVTENDVQVQYDLYMPVTEVPGATP